MESPTILLIGSDRTLVYLFQRYAERSGYQLKVGAETLLSHEIAALNPAVIIFLSTELLARHQTFVMELTDLEAPIVVCSSTLEEARSRELGADYCLLHPLLYDDFQAALANAIAAKGV
jgi:CheY-like chemotaxis protein